MNGHGPRRLPAAALSAAYLQGLPATGGLVLAGTAYVAQPALWLGPWGLGLVLLLLLVRLIAPPLAWFATRYELADDGISVTRGILWRSTRSVAWGRVKAVDIDEPWSFRLLGLAVVSLRPGGDDESVLTLPGVARPQLVAIRERAQQDPALRREQPRADSPFSVDPASSLETAVVVYRAGAAELVLASLAYGQFAVLGAGAILALSDVLDTLGVLDSWTTGAGWWATGLVALIAGAAIGFAITLLKFRHFTVAVRAHGGVEVSYGWLERHERGITREGVVGYRIQRNLLETLLGRCRVILHTTDADPAMANVVLPSLPPAAVASVIQEILPSSRRPELRLHSHARLLAAIAAAVVLAPALVAASAALAAGMPPWVALVGGFGTLVVAAGVGRLATARTTASGEWVWHRTRAWVARDECVRASAIGAVEAIAPRAARWELLRVHFFAGRPRAFTAFSAAPLLRREITDQLVRRADALRV